MNKLQLIEEINKIEKYDNKENIPFRILKYFCSENYKISISSHIVAKFGIDKLDKEAIDFSILNINKNIKVNGTIYEYCMIVHFRKSFSGKYYDISDEDALYIVERIKDYID